MIITLLTDFGYDSGYVAQMKGVAAGITDANIIDITHEVKPHNVREAAFILQSVVPYFPVGTIHVVVVDPGVGTDRKGIVITSRSHVLIGPDNGVLMPAAHFLGDFTVYEIANARLMLDCYSHTFHGRDIFTPVAAHITKGTPFEQIGPRVSTYVDLDFGEPEISSSFARGKVVFIDHFGNVITNIPGMRLRDVCGYGTPITLDRHGETMTLPYVKSYGFVEKQQPLVTIGSHNYVELSVNQGKGSEYFKLKEDDEIILRYA